MAGNIIFLHLSDLHFGDQNETNSAKRTNTLNKLLITLKKLPTEWKPQSIAISGDIGWHGLENDYNIAETWLIELLKILHLSADDIIPAPGNHDINLKKAAAIAVPSDHIKVDDLLDLDLLESMSVPFKGFEAFCKKMNIPPFTLGSKFSYLAGSRIHNGITWLVLNSAWFCREGRTENLHIGLPHLEVITAAKWWEKRDIPTIGVLHHPYKSLHDEEVYSYGSRRITYNFLARECHIILSGHVHGTLIDPHSTYQKTYLFTGGSSYSGNTERNNFSIFRLDKSTGTIERRAYEWNPANGEWEYRGEYSKDFPFIGIEKKPEPAVEENRDLHRRLFTCSRRHYEDLRGDNGRFRHLVISDIILQEPIKEWLDSTVTEHFDESEGNRGGTAGDNRKLLYSLPRLWIEGDKHAVVKGDGGMGKTVSLVRLWDELTKDYHADRPVPVFIQLNEINTMPEEKRMDFILSTIRRNYFDGQVSEDEIMRFLRDPRDLPAAVLLLDGFNEVTVDNKDLLIQLRKLMEHSSGVQVVITSRYDMRKAYGWEHLHLLELRGLEEKEVREYLQKKNSKMPDGRLLPMLRNPMMLTLYTSTCEVQGKYEGDFKEKVETVGELLWNFMEAQVAVMLERLKYDKKKWWFYKFLLKFMLPGVGYEMEKAGLFAFTNTQFRESLDRLCRRYSQDDFLDTFPQFGKYEDMLPLGEFVDGLDSHKRAGLLRDIFCNELHMLVQEVQSLRFLHQDFRIFFAAMHLLNEADISLSKGEISGVLKEPILDYFVRRLVGEIEGEHRCKPYLAKNEGWKIYINKGNRLHRVLDLCRGKFGEGVGYAVWNIVTIWKEVRGELSGADLSNLDLSHLTLNGVMCSRFYEERNLVYLAAVFDGSRVHEKNLLSQGHTKGVNRAVYSPDGKKILSVSIDHTIKKWDTGTGQCLQTMVGHSSYVTNAAYSPDGEKILSTSDDKTIKEWDAKTGVCLKTLAGHRLRVTSAVYSPDGKKILSASCDKTIKEWDAGTGECVKTLAEHTDYVNSAVYSPDGKRILSASNDKTITEWDVKTGEMVNILAGHLAWVRSAVYSPNGEKILSASGDHTIKEWDAGTGECVKTFAGHNFFIMSVVYNQDGKKILSASWDDTIKEWDVGTGE
ncbi:MAG: NACHT domain-containing protein, partial [Candidatus Aminicenantes bacterium]|nr:NACHT domain-containing protein [Candidatus Aminicenantes bacterium]NIM79798.1 NACHT domain-containing protein [Candidatus Aminicenantes bacterium]NIN19126.1 NACHT domain-containing protein [Candidatus Aminicenantes bacterium]NIN43028.1 NACHT domain-containing protein [Candidatus Aminicenantes bacterium]NIN85771.1 NACHT domain-containing protein [Candidatus Aminicenantes bacterium]